MKKVLLPVSTKVYSTIIYEKHKIGYIYTCSLSQLYQGYNFKSFSCVDIQLWGFVLFL